MNRPVQGKKGRGGESGFAMNTLLALTSEIRPAPVNIAALAMDQAALKISASDLPCYALKIQSVSRLTYLLAAIHATHPYIHVQISYHSCHYSYGRPG
jgi:hypothetical protein